MDGFPSQVQVLAIAGVAYGLAVVAGLAIVAAREPRGLMSQPEDTAVMIPAQAWTLVSFLLLAAGEAWA